MKALKDIRTAEEKKAFLSTLNETPCSEGLNAFLSFEGSVHEYFMMHERGGKAIVWCLGKGMLPQLRTPELCIAAVQQNGRAIQYLTPEQRKYVEGN